MLNIHCKKLICQLIQVLAQFVFSRSFMHVQIVCSSSPRIGNTKGLC